MLAGILTAGLAYSQTQKPSAEPANSNTAAFASGYVGGTYHKIATSLAGLFPGEFQVLATKGTDDNARLVGSGRAVLGLGQIDVLLNSLTISQKDRDKLKVLFPIFNEELHILATSKITSVNDLEDKKVAIGPKGSGSEVTAKILLIAYQIKFNVKLINMPINTALQKLKAKKIDALILVGGAPISTLKTISVADKIHLVSLEGQKFDFLISSGFPYRKGQITNKDYAWQKEAVATLAVPTVVFAAKSYPSSSLEKILKGALAERATLIQRHPKWSDFGKKFLKEIYPLYQDYADANFEKILERL